MQRLDPILTLAGASPRRSRSGDTFDSGAAPQRSVQALLAHPPTDGSTVRSEQCRPVPMLVHLDTA